jgi:hypothetical protein
MQDPSQFQQQQQQQILMIQRVKKNKRKKSLVRLTHSVQLEMLALWLPSPTCSWSCNN